MHLIAHLGKPISAQKINPHNRAVLVHLALQQNSSLLHKLQNQALPNHPYVQAVIFQM